MDAVGNTTRAIVLGVLLALPGSAAVAAQGGLTVGGQCIGDGNLDGNVTVDELVAAVRNALSGCPDLPVTLRFKAMVGDRPFACGQRYSGIGTAASDIIPSDFRLYIHDIRLVRSDGEDVPLALEQDDPPKWQYADLALLDFENGGGACAAVGSAETNDTVRGTAPPGDYRGVRFRVGVPFELNHGSVLGAPCPLCLSALFWDWQSGYKFMRVDSARDNLRIHLGSFGCEYGRPGVITSCQRPNRGEVFLDGFDPLRDVIIADLAAALADSDLSRNQSGTSPGCMSEPDDLDCEPILTHLGIDFASGEPDPSGQTFFRVE